MGYGDDGTIIVTVSGKYNFVMFERNVFGIKPEDLEECDLPSEGEKVGTVFKGEQADEYVKMMSQLMRTDDPKKGCAVCEASMEEDSTCEATGEKDPTSGGSGLPPTPRKGKKDESIH